MTDLEKEIAFRELAYKGTVEAGRSFKYAENDIKDGFDNQAANKFGLGIEFNFKNNIIFDDFRRLDQFTQETDTTLTIGSKSVDCFAIGSSKWKKEIQNGGILGDPKEIRKFVKTLVPPDERINIETDPRYNSDYLTLSKEAKSPNGHTLYSYYQLQSPVAKSLLNTEIFTYLEDLDNYCIFALLTEDILSASPSGKIILPSSFMDKLDENKDLINYRYPYDDEIITGENLSFVKQLAYATQSVDKFRFIPSHGIDLVDLTKLSVSLPVDIDDYTKRKMFLLLNEREKQMLNDYIKLLINAHTDPIHIKCFINNVVYLKDRVSNGMKINLSFETNVLGRIDNFTKLMKAFQPFDPNAKYLRDSELFDTPEKRKVYIDKIRPLRTKEPIERPRVTQAAKGRALEVINYLNQGIKEVMYPDNQLKLASGLPVGRAFQNHRDLIEELLFDTYKDNPEYETARRIIREYDFDRNLNEKVNIFIEMLNEGNGEILKPSNNQFFKGTNIPIKNFWISNKHIIKRRLFDELRWNKEYNLARSLIENFELQIKVSDFTKKAPQKTIIEMLSKAKLSLKESQNRFVEGLKNVLYEEYNEAKKYKIGLQDIPSSELDRLLLNLDSNATKAMVISIVSKCDDEQLRNYLIEKFKINLDNIKNYDENNDNVSNLVTFTINNPETNPKFKFLDEMYSQPINEYIRHEVGSVISDLGYYKNLLWTIVMSYVDEKDTWMFDREKIYANILEVNLLEYNVPERVASLLKEVAKLVKEKQGERNSLVHCQLSTEMNNMVESYKILYKYNIITEILKMHQLDENYFSSNSIGIITETISKDTTLGENKDIYLDKIKEILNNKFYKKS